MDASSSHIQQLPVELLTEIFILSSGKNELTSKVENIPGNTLSLVQRKWCDIAQQTPSLWSSIVIDLDCCWGNDARTQCWARLLNLVIQRSRSAPLTLYIENLGIEFAEDSVEVFRVLEPLISHCRRWKTLILSVNESLLRHELFNQVRGALPCLQSLAVEFNEWDGEVAKPVTLFDNCPALDTFECGVLVLPEIVLPWDQLTFITYIHPMVEQLVKVLPRCHRLKALNLDELCELDDDFEWEQRVSTPELTCLRLLGPTRNRHITQTLDVIQAPCLNVFEIEGFVDEPNHHHPHDIVIAQLIPRIETFITSSSCSIRQLSFKNVPFTDVELISVLRLMPTVDELIVHEVATSQRKPSDGRRNNLVTKRFLDHLRYDRDPESDFGGPTEFSDSSAIVAPPSALLPQLTALELRVFDEELDNDWCDALAQAAVSRWNPDSDDTDTGRGAADTSFACLRSLRLSTMNSKPFSCIGAFKQLIELADKEDGFEFVCDYSDI